MPPQRPRSSSSARIDLSAIRIDRLGRIALLVAIALLALFYLTSGLRMITAHYERVDQAEQVQQLKRENARLLARRKALTGQRGIATEARRLGMVMPGEVPYVVTGLPGDRR